MNKKEILESLNSFIKEERGKALTKDSILGDAELDSLGTIIVLAAMEAEYGLFSELDDKAHTEMLGNIKNLTVKEIIRKCVLSTTNASPGPNSKTEL